MIREAIAKVIEGQNLSDEEAREAMQEIMSGEATPAQISAFLAALRMKGETAEEITGCARAMREKVIRCDVGGLTVVDTCGTGGDGTHTFNISTAAALIAAGAGVKVAKHGNRSVSSSSGSADVLERMGVNINADIEVVKRCIDEANIGFLFAPRLHPAMKYAVGPRREIGVRTIFNILGPLTNPAGASRQMLGVFAPEMTEMLAFVLRNLGSERAFVIHGLDGLDEVSTCGETQVAELRGGEVRSFRINPQAFGIPKGRIEDLVVSSVDESASVIKSVLSGEKGPARDISLLNAGCVIAVAGLARDIAEGIGLAGEAVDSGAARASLDKLVEMSNSSAPEK